MYISVVWKFYHMDFLIGGASRTPHFFLILCRSHLSMRKNISDSASYWYKTSFSVTRLLSSHFFIQLLFIEFKTCLTKFQSPCSIISPSLIVSLSEKKQFFSFELAAFLPATKYDNIGQGSLQTPFWKT